MATATFSNVVRGVAFGDAWGDPHEFARIEHIIKNSENGPDLPDQLRITDDTQMTLFLADALDLTRNDDIPSVKRAIMDAFAAYAVDKDTSSRAPGSTVMGSLRKLGHGYDWKKATNTGSDGSGTIMRTSPTAFLPEDRWLGATAFAALVTHGAANSLAAAIIQAKLIRDLRDGVIFTDQLTLRVFELASEPEKWGLLDIGTDWIEDYEVDLKVGYDEIARLAGLALEELPALLWQPWELGANSDPSHLSFFGTFSGAGWRAHHTLICATMAVDMFPGDGWNGLRRAVMSDGDSDTIGAVAGALVGAAHPQLFLQKWATFGHRFEQRYISWIENEADDYEFLSDAALEVDGDAEVIDVEFEVSDETEAAAAEQLAFDEAEAPKKDVPALLAEAQERLDVAEQHIVSLSAPERKVGFLARWLGKSTKL